MNFGLVGWASTTGVGGINSDIASLAPWVSHWLVPKHPKMPAHQPFLDKASSKKIIQVGARAKETVIDEFLREVDGILYVEKPCLQDECNIVSEAKKRNKLVIGIPMWEWWPERASWALETDVLWAVSDFTNRYLNSLSDILYVQGYKHRWRGNVIGDRWGVDLTEFAFTQRESAGRFVFINGNGGYKLRKASDVVFKAFSRPGAPPLEVFTQQKERIAEISSENIMLVENNFRDRTDVYGTGDVFLFPSYWEGLGLGLYEAQAMGGVVITTRHPPMNECMSPYLVGIEKLASETLGGKKIIKAVPSVDELYEMSCSLYKKSIVDDSIAARRKMEDSFDLRKVLSQVYASVLSIAG